MQIHLRFSLGKMIKLTAIGFFFQISWYECGKGSGDSEIIIAQSRGQAYWRSPGQY